MANLFFEALGEALKKPLSMFLLGVLITLTLNAITETTATEIPANENPFQENTYSNNIYRETPYEGIRDIPSPQDYIQQEQIQVFRDRVIINTENIKWAAFEDTKSMLPYINKDSHALQIEPACPEEISVGDIVSYKSNYADGIIIHRVVHKDIDEQGPYFILRGDNNPSNDPGKIRCEQIQRRLIAIIY